MVSLWKKLYVPFDSHEMVVLKLLRYFKQNGWTFPHNVGFVVKSANLIWALVWVMSDVLGVVWL